MRDMTDSFAPGTKLWRVCQVLIKNAPAMAIVNGTPIVAKSTSTVVDDIYKQYHLNKWLKSPTPANWDEYQRSC